MTFYILGLAEFSDAYQMKGTTTMVELIHGKDTSEFLFFSFSDKCMFN